MHVKDFNESYIGSYVEIKWTNPWNEEETAQGWVDDIEANFETYEETGEEYFDLLFLHSRDDEGLPVCVEVDLSEVDMAGGDISVYPVLELTKDQLDAQWGH